MSNELKATIHNLTLSFSPVYPADSPAAPTTRFAAHLVADKVANPERCWVTGTKSGSPFASGAELLASVEAMPHDSFGSSFVRKVESYGLLFKSSDSPNLWTYVTLADFKAMCADIDEQLAALRAPKPPAEDIIPPGIYYGSFNASATRYKSTMTQSEVMALLRDGGLIYVFDGANPQATWAWGAPFNCGRVRKRPAHIAPFKRYANVEPGRFFHVVAD